MTTTPNQEQARESHVVTPEERRARSNGWERGFSSPYYPKEREATVLANIEKVSPAYVEGYWHGRYEGWMEDTSEGCEWYPYTGKPHTSRFE